MTQTKPIFRAVGLGGMGHVGGNLFVYETPEDLIAVDCGVDQVLETSRLRELGHVGGVELHGVECLCQVGIGLPVCGELRGRCDRGRGVVLDDLLEDRLDHRPRVCAGAHRRRSVVVLGTCFCAARREEFDLSRLHCRVVPVDERASTSFTESCVSARWRGSARDDAKS